VSLDNFPSSFCMAVLKVIVDFIDMLIGAEGARSSKMLSYILRAVLIHEAYSMSCGRTGPGRPQRRLAPRRLPGPPANRTRLERKSTAKFNKSFCIKITAVYLSPI